MIRPPQPRHDREDGQVLVMALVFVVVFGVLIGLVLTEVEVNLRTTRVVRSRTERTYAADAGIEYAVQRLSLDPTACVSEAPTSLPSQTANGRTATISCQVRPGGDPPLGASGWAAIITGNLTKQAGGTAVFSGPTYVRGTISGSTIKGTNGSVYQYSPTCPGALSQPGGLQVSPTPPYSWQCTTAPIPDPPHVLPAVPGAPKAPDTYDDCRVFYPGKYTAAPALLYDNYFVSGIYYFENIGTWSIPNDRTIVGGSNPADVNPIASPCRPGADSEPGGGGSGFGVEWIFGGTSKISTNNRDRIELHTRVPGPAETGVTPRISFVAVTATAAGYLASSPSGDVVFDTSNGHPAVAIHGLFYAPTVDVELDGPNGSSLFRNGAVVNDLHLKLSAQVSAAPIFIVDPSPTNKRYVVITATAASAGEAAVTARAVAEVRDTTSPATVVVHSWRTQ